MISPVNADLTSARNRVADFGSITHSPLPRGGHTFRVTDDDQPIVVSHDVEEILAHLGWTEFAIDPAEPTVKHSGEWRIWPPQWIHDILVANAEVGYWHAEWTVTHGTTLMRVTEVR